MAFTDETTIWVRAGKGGDGARSFHSEPFKPMGGPDGGSGGRGGSVILRVGSGARDLSWLARHPHQRAKNGTPGRGANRTGADADDLVIDVPDGTVVRDERGFVADLVGAGAEVVVAAGGRGGRGNAALASGRNKAPQQGEPGEPGEEHTVELELRTIADIGLVGLPSAGKSTLLAALTKARPKIGAYPFTTLTPNLGVAGDPDQERFVLADVPGLIEGAHQGKGLGHRFLRHISRCPALVCVVDATALDPAADVQTIRDELAAYDPALAERPMLVVVTKRDLDQDHAAAVAEALQDDPASNGREVITVSGTTGEGIDVLSRRLEEVVSTAGFESVEEPRAVVLRPGRDPFTVAKEGERYRVAGRGVERWVLDTDLEDPRAVASLQRRLVKEGVERKIVEAGARRGDEIVIAEAVFEFFPEEPGPVEGPTDREEAR